MAVRKGLGRGLDSIIPNYNSDHTQQKDRRDNKPDKQDKDKGRERTKEKSRTKKDTAPGSVSEAETSADRESNDGTVMVRIAKIEPNHDQPRQDFNEDSLQELSESIKQFGLIQPIVVQKKGERYEIVAGERRWRAARMAGLKEIPVIIKELTDAEVLELSLIENIQREDLNAIEEARAYKRLLEEFHLKQDELAERVSKSRTVITNTMRLLKLDDRVQEMLVNDMISAGHARALLPLEDHEKQKALADRIFDEKLSVRETEKLVKAALKPPQAKKTGAGKPDETLLLVYHNMEEQLRSVLGTKVTVSYKDSQKGKLEIEYYSGEELERIYDLLRRG